MVEEKVSKHEINMLKKYGMHFPMTLFQRDDNEQSRIMGYAVLSDSEKFLLYMEDGTFIGTMNKKNGKVTLYEEFKQNAEGFKGNLQKYKDMEDIIKYLDGNIPYGSIYKEDGRILENTSEASPEEIEQIKRKEEQEEKLTDEEEKKEQKQDENHIENKEQTEGKTYEIDIDAQFIYNQNLRDLIPEAREVQKMYVIEDSKTGYFMVKGIDSSGKEIDIESLEMTEGINPSQQVSKIGHDGDMEMRDRVPLAMFKIRGREDEGISILPEGEITDRINIEYHRAIPSRHMYITTVIPQATKDRGLNVPNEETRYFMDKTHTSSIELEKTIDFYEKLKEMQKQSMPKENFLDNGVQLKELDYNTAKELLIQDIKEHPLAGEDLKGFIPGYEEHIKNRIEKENLAPIIASKVMDEGMDYVKAREETLQNTRQQGGRALGEIEDPRRG